MCGQMMRWPGGARSSQGQEGHRALVRRRWLLHARTEAPPTSTTHLLRSILEGVRLGCILEGVSDRLLALSAVPDKSLEVVGAGVGAKVVKDDFSG